MTPDKDPELLLKFPLSNPSPVLQSKDGFLTLVNPAASRLLKLTEGDPLPDFLKTAAESAEKNYGVITVEENIKSRTFQFTVSHLTGSGRVNIYGSDITELRKIIRAQDAAYQQLSATEQQLRAINQQLRAAEQSLKQSNFRLNERVKELSCMSRVAATLNGTPEDLTSALRSIIKIIPEGFLYPSKACVKINLSGFKNLQTPGFRKTGKLLKSAVSAGGERLGSIEVAYKNLRLPKGEEPFLPEEKKLLKDIASLLGQVARRAAMIDQVGLQTSSSSPLISSFR